MQQPASESTDSDSPKSSDEFAPALGAGFDFSDPNSPLAPLYLSVPGILVVLLIAGVTALTSLFALWYSDIWGHVAFGRYMVESGTLPDREPFLSLAPITNEPIAHFYWLSQTFLFRLEQLGERLAGGDWLNRLAGGVEMLRLTVMLLVLFRLIPLLLAYRYHGGKTILAFAAGLLSALLMFPDLPVIRPQLFGQAFFALTILAISLAGSIRYRWFWIPSLFAIWANVHGSFLIGLGLLFLHWFACRLNEQDWRSKASITSLGLCVTAFVAVALFNPHGLKLFQYAGQLAGHPNVLAFSEWQPLHFRIGLTQESLFIFSLLVALITHFKSPRGLSNGELLLLLPFAIATAMQSRMITWWAMLLPWILVRHWQLSSVQQEEEINPKNPPSLRKTMLALLIAISFIMWTPLVAWIRNGQPAPLTETMMERTPWQLAEQIQPQGNYPPPFPELQQLLQQQYPQGKFTGGIFCSPTMGDYLIWRLPKETPVALYTHAHLISVDYWNQTGGIFNALPGWWELLERWNINLIVLEPFAFDPLRRKIEADTNWQVIHRGGPLAPWGNFEGWIAVRKKPLSIVVAE